MKDRPVVQIVSGVGTGMLILLLGFFVFSLLSGCAPVNSEPIISKPEVTLPDSCKFVAEVEDEEELYKGELYRCPQPEDNLICFMAVAYTSVSVDCVSMDEGGR